MDFICVPGTLLLWSFGNCKKKSHRYLVLQKSHQSYCIIVVHPLVLVTVGWVVLFEALQWVHLHFTRLLGTGSTGSLLFFFCILPFSLQLPFPLPHLFAKLSNWRYIGLTLQYWLCRLLVLCEWWCQERLAGSNCGSPPFETV